MVPKRYMSMGRLLGPATMNTQVRSRAGMHDRRPLARLRGSHSPYGMQHGSEQPLVSAARTCYHEQPALWPCWPVVLASGAGPSSWPVVLARRAGPSCWPVVLARNGGPWCWPWCARRRRGGPCDPPGLSLPPFVVVVVAVVVVVVVGWFCLSEGSRSQGGGKARAVVLPCKMSACSDSRLDKHSKQERFKATS